MLVLIACAISFAAGKFAIGSGDVTRILRGKFVEKYYSHRRRRDDINGEKGFRPLAAMMLYMQGELRKRQDPRTHPKFEKKLAEIESKFTNYGCYCWIDGVESGVIGGGKTRDMIDHHCKELYQCYKCVNTDYAMNYTDIEYTVDFTVRADSNGKMKRTLDCKQNGKHDGENICECDKRFAENVARAEGKCDERETDDPKWGAFCMTEQFRTATGGGAFDPHAPESCEKQHKGFDRNKCCGIYPNRHPYDINFHDCCEKTEVDVDSNPFKSFSLHPKGDCEMAGGTIVVNEPGKPHSYVALASLQPEDD